MGIFFASAVEKQLSRWLKESPDLEIKLKGEEVFRPSRLKKVMSDMVLLTGFRGPLKNKALGARCLENGWRFSTTIKKTGYSKQGEVLFACSLPEELVAPGAGEFRKARAFPHVIVRVLITTERGSRFVEMPVWNISTLGCSLLNTSDVDIRVGTSLYHSSVRHGREDLVNADLQVVNVKSIVHEKKSHPLLLCRLKSNRGVLGPVLERCIRES